MPSKPLVGGYLFKAELARAKNANNAIRKQLQEIIDELGQGERRISYHISLAAMALGNQLDALVSMEQIIAGQDNGEKTEESSQ